MTVAWMCPVSCLEGLPKKAEDPQGEAKDLRAPGLPAETGVPCGGERRERDTVPEYVLLQPLSCPPLLVKLLTELFKTQLAGEVTKLPF